MMTCEEFQKRLEQELGHQAPSALSEELRLHVASCKRCEAYQVSLLSLHAALLALPVGQVPAGMIARLHAIGQEAEMPSVKLDWMPEIRKGAIFAGLAAIMFVAQWLPFSASSIVQFVALTAGLTFLISNLLKPVFVAHNGR